MIIRLITAGDMKTRSVNEDAKTRDPMRGKHSLDEGTSHEVVKNLTTLERKC